MKTNPFAYLSKAPKIKGARRLKPCEVAEEGDRFLFLRNWNVPPHSLHVLSVVPSAEQGVVCIGSSLKTSRETWGTSEFPFDGVIYRPTSKKVSA